jgi:hypothetical protein
MFGAELSEVWQDYKPKKNKKKDKPLTPDEMDSGLLLEKNDKSLIKDERERLSSLVDDREKDYRYERVNRNVVTFDNPYGFDERREKIRPTMIEEDPDYREFLEFKKNKNSLNKNVSDKIINKIDEKDQINELILYIFTGFFLLILYDNIYRLGKKSY